MLKRYFAFIPILILFMPSISLCGENVSSPIVLTQNTPGPFINSPDGPIQVSFLPTFTLEDLHKWKYLKTPYKNNKILLDEADNLPYWHFEALTGYHYRSPTLKGPNFNIKLKHRVFSGAEFNFLFLKDDNSANSRNYVYSQYFIPFSVPSSYSIFEFKLGLKHLKQDAMYSGYTFGFNYELLPKKPINVNLSMEHAYIKEHPFYDLDLRGGFYWRDINFFLGYRYLRSKTILLSGVHSGVKYGF